MKIDSAKLSAAAVETQLDECLGRWPSEKARNWVEAFVLTARQDESTVAVVLLGSMVRPVSQVDDADIIHVFRGKKILLAGRPLDVDFWSYSAADVPELIAGGNDLLGWAIKFGCLLCERNRYWTSLREAWQTRLPFPSAKVALERSRRAGELCEELRRMGDVDAADEERLTQLTHLARARLLSREIYPASRPELPGQLRRIGERGLARLLSGALQRRLEQSRVVLCHQ